MQRGTEGMRTLRRQEEQALAVAVHSTHSAAPPPPAHLLCIGRHQELRAGGVALVDGHCLRGLARGVTDVDAHGITVRLHPAGGVHCGARTHAHTERLLGGAPRASAGAHA